MKPVFEGKGNSLLEGCNCQNACSEWMCTCTQGDRTWQTNWEKEMYTGMERENSAIAG